jgi:predicted ATPase/class 3 adenylate cyclase
MTQQEDRADPGITTGTLAFLFTDIAGSTRLWEQLPQSMKGALERHDAILRESIEASTGRVVKTTGDGLMAVFPTAASCVTASVAAQRALAAEPWHETGPLRVRMGLHAGDAERRGDDYFGPTVNRTARIMSAGHGGQVLLSAAAAALAADGLPDGASLRDLGEYRLKDLGRPERVFQLVHPALEATFPPLTTVDHAAASLPIQAAPFVGRSVELAEVERRLEDPLVRLLTLTGPGGTGKTSLGIRAAGDQLERFRDGVSFVDLSAARDTDSVLIALGRAVGIGEAPDRPLRHDLTDRLRDRQMLLMLDNFEQVTAAAGVTTDLLGDCPEVKLLVTSREPLHVRAEHVYAVPPLSLPPAARGPVTAAQLERYEAVQLFVERARAVRPDFQLDDDNAAAVAEICRRLDGLPLAIELAAARLRLFSPEALRDRLGSRLELLRSASRDTPERQQTLRATIDWSYQLLEPGEQRLFESFAVFADADLQAVEAVVAGTDAEAGVDVDVMEALASLLEKSLIRQVDVPHGEPRLLMLETIREYATGRLDERPAGPSIRRAHATYYADLAARLRRDLAGMVRDQAMMVMVAEVGNLRLAWRYWTRESDLGELTKLADSLLVLYEARAWYHDTVELTTNLLAVLAGTTSTPELVGQEIALQMSLARALLATRGFSPEAVEAYARALELFEGGRELRQHFSILRGLASLYLLRTDFDKAGELGQRIMELAERENDPSMRIDGHLIIGATRVFTGDLVGGLRDLDEAIGLFGSSPSRAVGSRMGNDPRVACLTTSAFSLWLLGFPDRAVERATAAIELARRLDHPYTVAYANFHSGLLHHWRNEPEIVLDRAVRLAEIADEYDFRIWSAIALCLMGTAQSSLGRSEVGLAQVREGMATYQGLVTPPVFWPMLLYLDAGASGRAGLPAQGLGPVDQAIALLGGRGADSTLMPEMWLARGDLLSALEASGADVGSATPDASTAEAAYQAALDLARQVGARMSELRAATRLCRSATQDQHEQRSHDLRYVLETFTEGFETADLVDARAALAAAQAR